MNITMDENTVAVILGIAVLCTMCFLVWLSARN